jgi:importin subunit alpha-1
VSFNFGSGSSSGYGGVSGYGGFGGFGGYGGGSVPPQTAWGGATTIATAGAGATATASEYGSVPTVSASALKGFKGPNDRPAWHTAPAEPSSGWRNHGADWIKLMKRFLLSGGDLGGLFDGQSVLELLASTQPMAPLDCWSFALRQGAPIVVKQAGTRHDAFLAVVKSAHAVRHEKDSVALRIALLKQLLDSGYVLELPMAAELLASSRINNDLHKFIGDWVSASGVKIVALPTHFDGDASPETLLRELDLVDPAQSIDAYGRLLYRVTHSADLWSKELLRRVVAAVPDASARAVTFLGEIERPALLVELLTLFDPLDWPLESRETALTQLIAKTRGRDVKLLAQAFDRTHLDVNHVLSSVGLTPLAYVLQREGSADVVELLLQKGAFVNAVAVSDGSTPLHLSCSAAIDEMLVRAGADPALRRFSDNLTPSEACKADDVDRRWFFARVLPVIEQHRKHAELLEICVSLAPLMHELPPEVIDKILAQLPGMGMLDEGMRYSLYVRVGAAHAKKLDGETVSLPARDRVEANKAIAVKELPDNDDAAAGQSGTRHRGALSGDEAELGGPRAEDLAGAAKVLLDTGSSDAATRVAITSIRRLLSIVNHPPIDDVIRAGLLPRMVQLAEAGERQTRFEALWAITNVCSGPTECVTAAIAAGALRAVTAALADANVDIAEQAVWLLGNVAGDSPAMRDLVLHTNGVVPGLIHHAANDRISLLRNTVWAISNLCRGKPQVDFAYVSAFLPVLVALLHHTDEEVIVDCCWAVSYLSDGSNAHIQAVLNSGVLPRLVQLLGHTSVSVQTPALRAIGNIATGDDMQTQALVNQGVLPLLTQLFHSSKKGIRKEAAWTVSNITAGSQAQIQACFEAGIIDGVLAMFGNETFDVVKEATWAISNVTSGGSHEHIQALVQKGAIARLLPLLVPTADTRLPKVVVEFLRNIWQCGNRKTGDDGNNAFAGPFEDAGVVDALGALTDAHIDEGFRDEVTQLMLMVQGEEEEKEEEEGEEDEEDEEEEGEEEGQDVEVE